MAKASAAKRPAGISQDRTRAFALHLEVPVPWSTGPAGDPRPLLTAGPPEVLETLYGVVLGLSTVFSGWPARGAVVLFAGGSTVGQDLPLSEVGQLGSELADRLRGWAARPTVPFPAYLRARAEVATVRIDAYFAAAPDISVDAAGAADDTINPSTCRPPAASLPDLPPPSTPSAPPPKVADLLAAAGSISEIRALLRDREAAATALAGPLNTWIKAQTAGTLEKKRDVCQLVNDVTGAHGLVATYDGRPCYLLVSQRAASPNGLIYLMPLRGSVQYLARAQFADLPDLGLAPVLDHGGANKSRGR